MAKQQPKSSTSVANKPEAPLMVVQSDQVPEYIKQDEQRGSENIGTDDITIPRLEIIQALSPAVKEGDANYIPEARPGMLLNSVTKQLYGKEVMVVPVIYMKQWLVWKKRKWVDEKGKEQSSEGGFFGAFANPEEARDRLNQAIEEGESERTVEIIDTPQHLCLLVNFNSGSVDEVMVSMPRTKAKISRQWNSMIRLAGGDRFSRVYRVTTALEKNKVGQDFYNFAIAQSGFPVKALYERAEKLYNQIQAGQRHVVVDVDDYDGEAATPDHSDPEM